jgi:hypothetical protein
MTALPELDGSKSPKLLSIALSPQGHLHVDAPGDSEVAPLLREIAKHFGRGDGHGVFRLGASQPETILPAGLTFWRDVGRSFVVRLCATEELEALRGRVEVEVPPDELAALAASAPPMTGGEYLTPTVLTDLCARMPPHEPRRRRLDEQSPRNQPTSLNHRKRPALALGAQGGHKDTREKASVDDRLGKQWRRRESNPWRRSKQKRGATRTYPTNPRNRLDMPLPFAPAPVRTMGPCGAESGHKEGTKKVRRRHPQAGYILGMSGRAQKVLGEALGLTDDERADVAMELVASLDGPTDADADDAWVVEIERRARGVLDDADGGQEWSVVRAELESKLRRP